MSMLEILIGAILSIITTIIIEVQRKPKLHIKIVEPVNSQYTDKHPAQEARFLNVSVENQSLPKGFRWLSRNAALQSHALIAFFHLDGQPVFSGPMVGRWSGSPEPIAPISISGERVLIEQIIINHDISSASHTKMDIYPGNGEELNIAARFDQDQVCYGWNNEAYFGEPIWRNPKWRMSPSRYIVKVEVVTSGERHTELFRLCNDVSMDSFRLELALKNDYELVAH